MMIDRKCWAEAYRLHAAALDKLAQTEQGAFWEWYHAQALQIAADNGNSTLIQGLLLAVFEDVEATDKVRMKRTA